jgi:hypothetical protein
MVVGRFQVMATLQAARAFELGLPVNSAKSWGLNRAIFYAAAKRGFKGGAASGAPAPRTKTASGEYYLGDEKAYTWAGTKELYFEIGGKPQTEKEFDKQIASRFGGSFDGAWEDALDYVRHFDRETLQSGENFFASVYRPKRDEFAAKWTASLAKPKPKR